MNFRFASAPEGTMVTSPNHEQRGSSKQYLIGFLFLWYRETERILSITIRPTQEYQNDRRS
eukprot:513013-Amphidinium_carterae.1